MGMVAKALIAWVIVNSAAVLLMRAAWLAKRALKRYIYARGYGASRGRGMLIVFGRRA